MTTATSIAEQPPSLNNAARRPCTVVLGIGNTLLGDEGAGVYAVRALCARRPIPSDVLFVDGGTLSFTLAPVIEQAQALIVIDAAELSAAPGTVRVFVNGEMDEFLGAHRKSSVHEVSLIDLLSVARLTDKLPERRALIGIQPQYIDWADSPTPAVARAIDSTCNLTMDLIERWRT
jgi:hydrogenase maturation protease